MRAPAERAGRDLFGELAEVGPLAVHGRVPVEQEHVAAVLDLEVVERGGPHVRDVSESLEIGRLEPELVCLVHRLVPSDEG
jgi:hypothetical protein